MQIIFPLAENQAEQSITEKDKYSYVKSYPYETHKCFNSISPRRRIIPTNINKEGNDCQTYY